MLTPELIIFNNIINGLKSGDHLFPPTFTFGEEEGQLMLAVSMCDHPEVAFIRHENGKLRMWMNGEDDCCEIYNCSDDLVEGLKEIWS